MQISEFVSLGHPDKVADYISSYILDRYIEKDPDTKYAVECQIKDYIVTLAGEVSSKAKFTNKQITKFVRQAINEVGYTKEYQKKWGKTNTICGDDVEVNIYIGKQSPDIAQGLKGWGDQGIFFGCAYPTKDYFEESYHYAKAVANNLYNEGILGIDIKTLCVWKDKELTNLIIAVPALDELHLTKSNYINRIFNLEKFQMTDVIVNGTGCYKKHGSIADSGTTGRKLAVDFYGGSCKIGGGSPWTKDGSKADLTLNLYARYLAVNYLKKNKLNEPVFCEIACCIGQKEIYICIKNEKGEVLKQWTESKSPKTLIKKFKLNTPIYAELCRKGLFHRIK